MGGVIDKTQSLSAGLDPTGLVKRSQDKTNEFLGTNDSLYGQALGFKQKKKKLGPTAADQQNARNKAAGGANPLLRQTALSPDEKVGGAGTALL